MQGKCYWCNKQTTISKVPVAGIRVCTLCLAEIGHIFLQQIGYLKKLEIFESTNTSESVRMVLNYLYDTYNTHKE